MRKDSVDKHDFCPDCVNETNEVESDTVQCEDEECCNCCCCCCCSGTESEGCGSGVNPADSEEMSDADRMHAQKKDLLSSLSITRTNRERATIQNVLQFVEALTHSNTFLRRYNLEEDFCFQCLEESVRNCFIQNMSRMNVREECTCSSCEVNDQDVASHRMRSSTDNCPDCTTTQKIGSERPRGRDRRGRRRRRRTRISSSTVPESQGQHERQLETPQQNSNIESGSYESDCSECQRGHTRPGTRTMERLSDCEQCQNGRGNHGNLTTPRNQQRHSQGKPTNCSDCVPNSSYTGSKLSASCCNFNSNAPGDYCCGSDCEDCQSSPTEEASCECCRSGTETGILTQDQNSSAFLPGSRCCPTPPTETSDKDSILCDCDDCRDSIECSEDSCDECSTSASQSKKSNKK